MSTTVEPAAQEKPDAQWFNKRTANQFAQQLGDGSSPLQKHETQELPYNPATGRPYHGINAVSLMMQGRQDDRWLTWDEAKQNGLSIIKGEKPTPIQYWPKKRQDGEPNRAITTWLYNGEQLSGMPPKPHKPERPDPMTRVLDILKNSGATIVYDREHRGYYSAKKDEIHLPNPDKVGKEQFCEDALNQYFKSTGHPSRLNRDTFNAFTGYKQSKEELICGVATAMMCAELGIPPQPARNADLVEGWQGYMTEKPVDLARDIGAADKAVWTTLQHEHTRNRALNPRENEVWRPVPEEFPHGAVKTFLDRKDVLDKIENSPDKLDRFSHEGREVFALPESGYLLDKKEHVPDDPAESCTLRLKTQGFDRLGNAHDITVQYDIKLDGNGLSHRTTPPEATRITEAHKNMMLPRDWSGTLRMAGCSEDTQGNRVPNEQNPDFFTIFAKRENGQEVGIAEFSSRRDGEKYIYQMNRQYEYQAERRGIEVDFAEMRNPDRGFSSLSQESRTAPQDKASAKTVRKEPVQDMDQTTPQIEPTEQTRAECIAAMESVGMIVKGDHPIFDGKGHRIDVEGDRPGQGTGWYVAHADGRPSGTCMNNRTKDKVNWSKSQGHELDPAKRSELREIAKTKKETYEKTTAENHQKAAKRLAWMMDKVFTKPSEPTPYLANKGLPLDPGIFQNQGSTCIPIHDAKGNVHSMAYVKEDGTKNYAKESNKNGHFYAYGGLDALKKAPAIIICEGYSTAASVSMATGQPTIAAFDSGNLTSVAETLHKLFPDKPIIIAGDDDRHLEARTPPERNSGREEALKAAKAVNGQAVFPRWEANTPAGKGHKDFDDVRKIHGTEAVRSQLTPVIEREVERSKEQQTQQAEQEKTRGSLARS